MIQPLLVFSDWGILLLRLALGLILIIHGFPKFKNLRGIADYVHSLGFRPALFWAFAVAVTEAIGGVFVLFGFSTQIAAMMIALQFLIIIIKVNFKKGFVGGYEFDLLIFVAALALATLGGGAYSLDRFLGFIIY